MSRMPQRAVRSAAAVADPLADAFADMVVRLHLRLGGAAGTADVVGAWAARAWAATAQGHVCLALQAPPVPSDRAGVEHGSASDFGILADSPAVTHRPDLRAAPLALDRGALYLYRWWQAEASLAGAVAALDGKAPVGAAEELDRALAPLFCGPDDDPGQRRAAQLGLERRLALVTGGPGTGKTTTLARLLVAFLRLRPQARVAFAAPTGKAAARLAQSLRAQLPVLDPHGELTARLPGAGLTVHRLLAELDDRGDAGAASLHFDLVIVDEASMLDVEIASRLVRAIPAHGRLVLAGDRDQLASVEAGAVFSELCIANIDGLARLERNYRQADAPGITRLAAALRDGDANAVRDALADAVAADTPSTQRGDDATAAAAPRAAPARSALVVGKPSATAIVARDALEGYQEALDALAAAADAREVLARFDRYRVLCALHGGDCGAHAVNRAVAAAVRKRFGAAATATWYPGRLVMIGRNEADLGLFNGDVGVCMALPAAGVPPGDSTGSGGHAFDAAAPPALAVAFLVGDVLRWIPVLQMPGCDDAYAITVHKSQGSEFECAAVVPAPAGHPMNTRELLYTAVTRARRRLVLWADPAAIVDAAGRRTIRNGLLAERLASPTADA